MTWPMLISTAAWTLAHFLWQGLALALPPTLVFAAARSPRVRYAAGMAALGTMLLAPLVTFVRLADSIAPGPSAARVLLSLLQRELARKGAPLNINRMLEELGGIRETLGVYPRRQGQRQAPTATCLTRMTALQQRLFSLLGLQRFVPASR